MRPAPQVRPVTHSRDRFSGRTPSVPQGRGVTGLWILTRRPVSGSRMVMAHPPDQALEMSLQAVANNTIIGAPTPSHQVGLFTATLSLRAIQPVSLRRGKGNFRAQPNGLGFLDQSRCGEAVSSNQIRLDQTKQSSACVGELERAAVAWNRRS